MITKRSISKPNSIEEFGEIAISKKKPKFPLLASTIQFSNHHAPHVSNPPRRGTGLLHVGIEPHHDRTPWGGGPGAQKHTHTTPGHPDGTPKPMISSTPASPCETVEPSHGHGAHTGHGTVS